MDAEEFREKKQKQQKQPSISTIQTKVTECVRVHNQVFEITV